MNKKRVAIVVAEFHKKIADAMIASAERAAHECGATVRTVVRVPGCFEIPLAVKKFLLKKTIDAVVVLGYIEKGETLHGEVMGHVVHHALMQLQLTSMKPIGFGIIGPGATEQQARARMKKTAQTAARVACALNFAGK